MQKQPSRNSLKGTIVAQICSATSDIHDDDHNDHHDDDHHRDDK